MRGGTPETTMTEPKRHESKPHPLVSVITPTYNRATYLDETIQSVLGQDYPSIECLVLDDGSTDNTLAVLRKYAGRIAIESHPNMGEAKTVNKGFLLARGDILVVVNSDDPLLPGAVSTAATFMQAHPSVLAAYPDWLEIGPQSEPIRTIELPDYDIFNMLLSFSVSIGPGTFIRRSALEMVGIRDTQFRYVGDLEFWFRLALAGPLGHIRKTLATHRTHPTAASVSERGSLMAEELVRMVQKVYTNPALPPELRKQRGRVLGEAHYVAISYCGASRRAMLEHHLASLTCHPLNYGKHVCHVLLSTTLGRILRTLLRPVYRPLSRWSVVRRLMGREERNT